MSQRGSRHSRPVAGTPLARRQALSLGVLALGSLFDPLPALLAAAESKKAKDKDGKGKDEVPADLRAYVERRPAQSAVVYADGVAILNRDRQLRLDHEDVAAVARVFRETGFDAMPDKPFGTGKKRLQRRASLRRGGRRKEVAQLIDGEQSEALKKLVDGVFALLEPKAANGTTAASLSEGLRKVADGSLAPQCLTVVAFRKPETGQPASAGGWMLQLQEATATASAFSNGGFADPRALPLDPARLARLAKALAVAQPESLPGNLYGTDSRSLTVEVLEHRKIIAARPFTGMKPNQHGEKQAAFDKAFEEVDALARDAREHGQPVADAAKPGKKKGSGGKEEDDD